MRSARLPSNRHEPSWNVRRRRPQARRTQGIEPSAERRRFRHIAPGRSRARTIPAGAGQLQHPHTGRDEKIQIGSVQSPMSLRARLNSRSGSVSVSGGFRSIRRDAQCATMTRTAYNGRKPRVRRTPHTSSNRGAARLPLPAPGTRSPKTPGVPSGRNCALPGNSARGRHGRIAAELRSGLCAPQKAVNRSRRSPARLQRQRAPTRPDTRPRCRRIEASRPGG